MLDAFKRPGAAKLQSDELQALLAASREERAALSTMLTQMQMQSAKLASAGKALQEVEEKADKAHARLDQVNERLAQAAKRTSELEQIDARIASLTKAVDDASRETSRLTAPDGDLERHKQALQELSAQSVKTRASLEALKEDQASLDGLRGDLQHAQTDIKASAEGAGALKQDLDRLQSMSAQLSQEHASVRESSRAAHDEANATVELVREMEQRLGSLSQLQEMSRSVEERMNALDTLAGYVTDKVKTLDSQKQTVERAVVEANRLNDLVRAMEAQVQKLNDGARQASRTEDLIGRVDQLAQEVGARLDSGLRAREAFAADLAKLDDDRDALTTFIRGYLDRLALERAQMESLDQRVNVVQGAVAQAEKSMDALAVRDRAAVALSTRIDQLGKQLEALNGRTDDVLRKQPAVEALHESLGRIDGLTKRTAAQYAALTQSRADLDALRQEIAEFHKSYAAAALLRDRIGADRADLESFLARATEFSGGVPELESRIASLTSKLAIVDDGARKAASLGALTEDLDRRITRVSGLQDLVTRVEQRLNALHALSGEVDNRIEAQIVRSNEVESLHHRIEGIAVAVMDAQQKLEALDAVQAQVGPLRDDVIELRSELERVYERYAAAQQEEAAVNAQEKRLIEMLAATRATALETEQRFEAMQGLADDLRRSGAIKDELLQEVAQAMGRQREVAAQLEAAEDQLARLEAASAALGQHRSELTVSEKRMAAFEARAAELARLAEDLDARIADVGRRQAVVEALRDEVAAVVEIGARARVGLTASADAP